MSFPPSIPTSEFDPVVSTSVGSLVFAGVLGVLIAVLLRRMGIPEMIGLLVGGAMSAPLFGVSLSDVSLVHELLYFTALGSLVLLVGRWRKVRHLRRLPVSMPGLVGGGAVAATTIGLLGLLAGWVAGEMRTGLYVGLLVAAFVLPGAIWFEWDRRPRDRRMSSVGRLWTLVGTVVILLALPWIGFEAGADDHAEIVRIYALGLYMGAVAFVLGTAWVPGLYARARRTSGMLGKIGAVVPLAGAPVVLAAWMKMPLAYGAVWAGLLVAGCFGVAGDRTRMSERILTAGMLLLLGMSIDVRALVSGELAALVVGAALVLFGIRNIAGTVLDSVSQWADEASEAGARRRSVGVVPLAGLPLLVLYEGGPAALGSIGGEQLGIQLVLGVFVCLHLFLVAVSKWTPVRSRPAVSDRAMPTPRTLSGPGLRSRADRSIPTAPELETVFLAGEEAGTGTVRFVPVTEHSAATGRSLADLELKDRFGVRSLGLWRGDVYLPITGDEARSLQRGDLLILAGSAERLEATADYLAGTDSADRAARDPTY